MQNRAIIVVSFVFLVRDILFRTSQIIGVYNQYNELLFGETIFHVHLCHVTLECPKPKQPRDLQVVVCVVGFK